MGLGATVAELRARLSVDQSDKAKFKRDMADADRSMGRTATSGSRSFSKLGMAAKAGLIGGAAAGFYALGKAAKIGWDEYNQGQKVAAQTNAVIKSTGGIAKVSAKDVESLGHSLMLKSGIDDEVIKTGENMLLTFKNIRNEVGQGNDIFNQATKTLTDMTVALGSDPQKQAIQLGKALNDPIAGLSALARVGVTFTQGQKDAIAAMVDSGHTMQAQKTILKELRSEFGGSARAAGHTLAGQINILKESFNNWAGDMVAKVIPTITQFVDFVDRIRRQRNWDIRIHTILAGAGSALDKILFGSPATRVQVPIEGGRFEWQVKGGGTGLVGAVANAIRDIDWVKVGTEIALGLKHGTEAGIRAAGFDPTKGLIGQVWPHAFGWTNDQLPKGPSGWDVLHKAFGLLQDDADAATYNLNAFQANTGKHMRSAQNYVTTFQQSAREHLGLLNRDADSSTTHVDGLRGAIDKLHSKTVKVTADVSGLSTVAAMQEHLAWMNTHPTINVRATGSGDGVVGTASNPGGLVPQILDDLGLANSMGLMLSSGYRPGAVTSTGNPSLHAVGKAIDVTGSEASMSAYFWREVSRGATTGLAEIIHSPLWWHPGVGVTAIPPTAGTVLADHYNHVHVGTYDRGGFLQPGWNFAYNGTGRPEPVGAGTVYNFNGPVLDGDRLLRFIQNEKQQYERRNGRSPF